MASIDRYRPQREGYQPPSIPQSQPSRSPTHHREVPPPAPSPPTHSSRTSPPRPRSRRDHQSPPPSTPQTPAPEPANQWLFTPEEILSTPSILDGLPPAKERELRAKGVNFIIQAGILLDLPQITLWVAGVFFHRFFMRHSMVVEKGGIHHYQMAGTALFLANKTEENCRKTKDMIIALTRVALKNARLIIDEQSKDYWRWRDTVLHYEELMLELLTFDLIVDSPHQRLFDLLGQLGASQNKVLRQAAWTFCNDAGLTALPLLMEARDIAVAAIFFASVHTEQPLDDVSGQAWWRFLGGDEAKCVKAIEVMRQFYTENPLQKRHPSSLPSPAFMLENTRRRGDTTAAQTPPHTATPADVDRGTQSPPRSQANGGMDRLERDVREATLKESGGSASQEPLRQGVNGSGAGNASPSGSVKRKDVSDGEVEDYQPRKRVRASPGGEEGEVEET